MTQQTNTSAVFTMSPPLELRKGTEIQGRYVLSDCLGSGAFGTVWKATDKLQNRDVALKRLNRADWRQPERDAAMNEARHAQSLRGHKNIVEVYDVVEEQGEVLIVMEFVDGPSLEQILQKHALDGTWVPVDEAIDYLRQILEGLLSAHSSGLIHRDIKPANILVSSLGVVKIGDFGIAKAASFSHTAAPSTLGGGFAGTGSQSFMSFEQARGHDLDQQSDIFSAGIIGYLLLAGQHPFNHPSGVFSIFDLIKHEAYACKEIPSRPALPESVRKAVMQMLVKERSQRYGSVLLPLEELTRGNSLLCAVCSEANPVGSNFCNQCGEKLGGGATHGTGSATKALDAQAFTDEGFELTKMGEWERAVEKYEAAISADAAYGRAYSNLGYALNRLGNYERSIEVLTKGIEIEKSTNVLHRLYDARGFAHSNLKRLPEAINDFSQAISHNSANPRVFYHRAESNAQIGDLKRAYADVQQALRLDSDFAPALRLKQRIDSGRFGLER